jgi:hypothetical protein
LVTSLGYGDVAARGWRPPDSIDLKRLAQNRKRAEKAARRLDRLEPASNDNANYLTED